MDSAAEQSVKILRQAGIKVETTSKSFGSWAWGMAAGIHCSTNEVAFPMEGLVPNWF